MSVAGIRKSEAAPANGKPGTSIPRGERERELERLLRAGIVREHTQLNSLLAYLGSKSLDDNAAPPKEYTIGIEALNKPADYDPRVDPTVRVEVAKLRKKLEDYYLGPGANHAVKLVIPRGGYLPVYAAAAPAPGGRMWRLPVLVTGAALALAAMAIAAAVWTRVPHHALLAPELEAFWGPHLEGGTPTLLVYGTPLFTKFNGAFFRDPHVNSPEEANASGRLRLVEQAMRPRSRRIVYGYTGVGEAEALFLLTRMFTSRHVQVAVHNSSAAGWKDFKGKHVVLLGGRKYNPLLPELPYKPRFESLSGRIVDLRPVAGSPSGYATVRRIPHGEIMEEYALISVYPGLSAGTRLVVLDSSSTEGTLAAAEFVTRPDMLRELIARKVPLTRHQGAIHAFQVLLRAGLNKGVVVSLSYVTHAVLS